jgi:multidrug efflux system membrane fusion protein
MDLRCALFRNGSLLLIIGIIIGCNHQAGPEQATETLVVPVSKAVRREVTDYVDYTGRTAAINSVDIRPRVTGYLMKMPLPWEASQ